VQLIPSALTDLFRTGSFRVTTPAPPDDPVIQTVVYIDGDVITTVCDAGREPSVVADHFRTVAAKGQAASEQLHRLVVAGRAMWLVVYGVASLWTAAASSLGAAAVVVASAALTAGSDQIGALKARVSWPLDLVKIVLLVVFALLGAKTGQHAAAVGCVVSAVLDSIVFVLLEGGRILVRRTVRGLGVHT
jgi:hypothetical protein